MRRHRWLVGVVTFLVATTLLPVPGLWLPDAMAVAEQGDLAEGNASTDEQASDSADEQASKAGDQSMMHRIDAACGRINEYLGSALMFTIPIKRVEVPVTEENPDGTQKIGIPLIVFVLVGGGFFFTLRYGFVNLRLFAHAIQVTRGKYDAPDHHGEISHFQALTSALSATVGLGNIAGVAAAISLGGPGAVFWMWIIAFFGMSMKFSSCTFAQLFRRNDGSQAARTLGGPMVYLEEGLGAKFGWPLGKLFGVVYAVLCILASFGGGNLFQSNQTSEAILHTLHIEKSDMAATIVGCTLAVLVAIVIIGGIRRIGEVTSKIVPAMCLFYVCVCLFVILSNISKAGALFQSIFQEAFTGNALGGAAAGGLILVFVQGARRAVFSNEAGVGSASIVHAAAKCDEPVREGVVAMLGPFIDTIVICTMTALTLLITDVFGGQYGPTSTMANMDARMTIDAFGEVHQVFKYMLCVAIFVFAYSTIISWSYYGDRAVEYLFGRASVWPYRVIFVLLVALGPFCNFKNVLEFSDLTLLSMAFPNILGMLLLSSVVAVKLRDYVQRLKSGEIHPYH